MTNNYNYNLANKLFAYIKEANSLTPELAELYQNSLIFLGNEQQIYVPAKQAYVGIGTTAYNNTQTAINELKSAIAGIENGSGLANVRKLWVGAGPYAYNHYGSNVSPAFNTPEKINAMSTYLTGDVTIWGAGINTDATTGLSYNGTDWVATADGGFISFNGGKPEAVATSGITISYVSQFEQRETVDGISYNAPLKQLITIDDSKTWSYMRGAYNYSLNFTKDYISSRIESVYKNLVGSSDIVMMPISSEDFENSNYTADKVWYRDNSGTAPLVMDVNATMTDLGWFQTPPQNPEMELAVSGESTGHAQKYICIKGYTTTYNGINLSDGINTLKEVAALLDKLSDGSLGSVTYLTKTQWETGNYTDGVNNYYRVRDKNGEPVTNESKYGYFVNTGNPENLGIQIAYSIAGNKAEIDDLHYHVELAEQGVTTVRSIGIDTSPMVYAHATSSQAFTQTDTNQSIPASYSIGDVRNMIGLNLAMTYTTLDPDFEVSNVTIDGVYYHNGAYQLLDKYQWGGSSVTHYTWDEGESTYNVISGNLPATEGWTSEYYYKGNSTTYAFVNDKFALITNEAEFAETSEKFIQNANGHFETTNDTQYVANTYYKRVSTGPDVVTHANTDFGNQIATTAWTLALLNDMNIQASSLSDASSILEEIQKKVNSLDFRMAYSDFNDEVSGVPGTTEWENNYNTARQNWYETYFGGSIVDGNGHLTENAKIGYVGNKVRSQYISNFEEENGIVKVTETRELPTDMLDIDTSIWGNQDSGVFVKQYSEINYDSVSALFEEINSIENHQIYYKDGTTTYEKSSDTGANYVYINGEFVSVSNVQTSTDPNSAYWKQRYKEVAAYYEVDIDTITIAGGQVTGFNYGKYDDNGEPATFSGSNPTLYKVSNTQFAYSTKYITGAVQHYSYLNDGGEGQNKFSLVTHITHLEDASPINTGLVDAWDVASFISNMCEWADLDDLWVKDV